MSNQAVEPAVQRRDITVSTAQGGLAFTNMGEVVEFAKLMAMGGVSIPKHLRDNPGACLAVTMQAVEWRMSPFAVANKSYSVNDRLAYESQLIQAVLLARAPIVGRIAFSFDGEGPTRRCLATAVLQNDEGTVTYATPMVKDIKVKNSPLWAQDPDQQLTYYAGRALARRYFPDVLLGIYAEDELREEPAPRQINPLHDDVEAEFTVVTDGETDDRAAAPAEDAPQSEEPAKPDHRNKKGRATGRHAQPATADAGADRGGDGPVDPVG
jgi:hypothetical protein